MTDKIIISRKEIERIVKQLQIMNVSIAQSTDDLRALLDKAEVSEPVAWVDLETSQHFNKVSKDFVGTFLYGEDRDYTIPLYTAPPDQSAKIVELEAEIARLNAIIGDMNVIDNVFGKGE